jgi:hypothetical protein
VSGHVFHPGHHSLHGITVVLETAPGRTYIGRFDTEDERGVHLLNVAVHEPNSSVSREEFVQRSAKFGVRSEHPHVLVPSGEVTSITPLGQVSA